MSSFNSTSDIFRPEYFIIRGFSEIPYNNYYCIFLFLCYMSAVVGNLFVMTIICVIRSLHTPKYMAVFSLALADFGSNTSLIPITIETLIFNTPKITYEDCLITMFFQLFFFGMQSLTLTVLAYDRFVAICFPLRYHSVLTNTSMGIMIMALWLLDLTIISLMVSFLTRLSFCNSIEVLSYFCDHGTIHLMACNDNILSDIMAKICVVTYYLLPLAFIGLSYASILLALFKIAIWEERIKALKTCTSHLILVAVFYVPLIGTDVASFFFSIDPNANMIGMSLSLSIPPVLNPIVYSLNTAEIKGFVKKMFKTKRHNIVIPAISL